MSEYVKELEELAIKFGKEMPMEKLVSFPSRLIKQMFDGNNSKEFIKRVVEYAFRKELEGLLDVCLKEISKTQQMNAEEKKNLENIVLNRLLTISIQDENGKFKKFFKKKILLKGDREIRAFLSQL